MAEKVTTTDEQVADDDVDGLLSSSRKSKDPKDPKKSKESKEKGAKDKSKKKGLFKKLSKSDSKGESKKHAKSKSRDGETEAVEKDSNVDPGDTESEIGSTTKVVDDESQSVSTSSLATESSAKSSSTSIEKPKKKKKLKFGVFKKSKKKKEEAAKTHDAAPTADSGSQAPNVQNDQSHSTGEDDSELVDEEKSKVTPENAELEKEGTEEEEKSDERYVVSMEIQLASPQATSDAAGEMDQGETPGDLVADESTGSQESNEDQSSPSSKPTPSAELAVDDDDIPTEGKTPGDVEREGEVSESPPLDDHSHEKTPEQVNPEAFTRADQTSVGENVEDEDEVPAEEQDERLPHSEIVAEEIASEKVVVVEQQPGDETPEERPSDDNDVEKVPGGSQNSESNQEDVAPKEGVLDEQVSEKPTADDAATSTEPLQDVQSVLPSNEEEEKVDKEQEVTEKEEEKPTVDDAVTSTEPLQEPLQDVHSELPSKEEEENGDKEEEITEKDEEKEIEKEKEKAPELNADENDEEQEHPGMKAEISKSDEEITAGSLGVTEEHGNDKKESDLPAANVTYGKDDANNEIAQSEISGTTAYLSLGEGDSGDDGDDKSCSVRKRITDSGDAELKASQEKCAVEASVHVTKKRALFSLRNWCCTIL